MLDLSYAGLKFLSLFCPASCWKTSIICNATYARKRMKRATLVISVTPSQNSNGIQTASLAPNRPEGVSRLLMSQWDIDATITSSLSGMMSNFDRQ